MKKNKLDVWMISKVSAFLGQAMDSQMENLVEWYMKDGSQVIINFNTKEFIFADWVGDDKTYYSIVGVASMSGFSSHDALIKK